MGLIKLAAASAVGYALYKYVNKEKEAQEAPTGTSNFAHVRDAGPDTFTGTQKGWSKTDEAIDESFPASDPPSTY